MLAVKKGWLCAAVIVSIANKPPRELMRLSINWENGAASGGRMARPTGTSIWQRTRPMPSGLLAYPKIVNVERGTMKILVITMNALLPSALTSRRANYLNLMSPFAARSHLKPHRGSLPPAAFAHAHRADHERSEGHVEAPRAT